MPLSCTVLFLRYSTWNNGVHLKQSGLAVIQGYWKWHQWRRSCGGPGVLTLPLSVSVGVQLDTDPSTFLPSCCYIACNAQYQCWLQQKLNDKLRKVTQRVQKEWWAQKCEEIEELDKQGKQDQMYKAINDLNRKKIRSSISVKDENGKLISDRPLSFH